PDGVALTCPKGVALPCGLARSTIDSKAIRETANMRMAKYASGTRRFFKHELAKFRYPKRTDLSWPFLDWDTPCDDPCGEIERAVDLTAVAEARNPSTSTLAEHLLCSGAR